ncbi:hypothetical protein ACA910_002667 [Epithemia clementina (nom. ined.)]
MSASSNSAAATAAASAAMISEQGIGAAGSSSHASPTTGGDPSQASSSFDQSGGNNNNNTSGSGDGTVTPNKQQQQKQKEDSVAGIALPFCTPTTAAADVDGHGEASFSSATDGGMDDPTPLLSALRDEHSSYRLVARAVQQICQFASHGCAQAWSAADVGGGSGEEHAAAQQHQQVIHTTSYIKIVSHTIQSLTECLQSHKDRRCRTLAAQTLALLGKAVYARIRPTPLLYTARDTTLARLQDELGAELPTALVTAVLQEDDDGVSSAALEAVGRLVLFHSGSAAVAVGAAHGTVEDCLAREIMALAAPKVAATAPTLRSLVDEEASIAAAELANRCLHTVILPRLFSLLERVLRYITTCAVARAIPVLTTALIHHWQTTQPVLFASGMDKLAYAKQWSTVDAGSLVQSFCDALLVPILQNECQSHVVHTAALSALRLCQAASDIGPTTPAPWIVNTCRHVTTVQHEALTATPLSLHQKLHILATIIIAARALAFPERSQVLFPLVDSILSLPSTTRVPLGVLSPGLVLSEYANRHATSSSHTFSMFSASQPHLGFHYRRPARIIFWTELALHFFLDGPTPSRVDLQMYQLAATSTGSSGGLMGSSSQSHNKSAAAAAAATAAAGGGRQEALRKFFHLPVVSSAISEASFMNARPSPLLPRDELLLAFTTVAIACGRRFRGGTVDPAAATTTSGHASSASSNSAAATAASLWPLTDPSSPAVEEWLQLSWVVLTAFVPCVNMSHRSKSATYLEEDLSLGTAGLTCYVQLLQEYLHFAGLLHPGSSVALKLVANACPPHLLWDQLSDSAAFMARFEALDMGLLDNTTKLMDEIVSREMTKAQGIPSHHMRLFVLALASDHWMQGRVAAIRKQFESNNNNSFGSGSSGNNTPPPNLDAASAREIILALSPKRILTKIFQAHVPPVDAEGKKKKDPIKRLAVETVRVCVACIENIALIACDWRKRFPPPLSGSNAQHHQEPKHVVSVAVGVLQGKVDETPMNETIKVIMGPICEAAVSRIQSFYESDLGGQDSFPASELVMQNVKTKIKPLVSSSSSRPPIVTKDDFARGYLMQLCRSLVLSRAEQAIHSFPPADAELAPARGTNWLRLTVAPPMMADSRDGRLLGNHFCTTDTFGTSVNVTSAGSDPVAILLAFTPRRYFRHDGEDEFRVTALMQVYNTTNIEFTEGLRLELALVNQGDYHFDGGGSIIAPLRPDSLQKSIREALGLEEDDTVIAPMSSSVVYCKQELKPGEYLSWEVALDHACTGEGLCLVPSVVFPNVPKEPVELGSKWTGEVKQSGDASTINTGSAESSGGGAGGGGEDDFQVTTETTDYNRSGGRGLKDTVAPSENVTLIGEALPLPPMIQLQPCPLVFLRDRWGDLDAFRLLWFRMPFHLPEVPVARKSSKTTSLLEPSHLYGKENHMMSTLANMSSLVWNGEAIPGGYVTRAWAFATLQGQRVLAVLSESDSDKKLALHFRGDDPYVLYGLVGPPRNRQRVVMALTPALSPVQMD